MAQMAMQAQSVDPFDAALANLKGILVDLDGDGSPDASVAPQDLARGPGRASVVPQYRPEATGNPLVDVGFRGMVERNPRGWMSVPPVHPASVDGELQSYTPSLEDRARTSLVDLGMPQEQAGRAASVVPFTPQGIAYEGGQRLGEGDVLGGATRIGMAVSPTAPARILSAASRAPRFTGGVVGGATMFATPSEAGEKPSPQVQRLQEQMRDAGYYSGPIDGLMGGQTQAARQAFERDQAERMRIEAERESAAAAKAETERQRTEAEGIATARKHGDERLRQIESEVPWYSQALRDYGPLVGYVGGAGLGAATRYGVKKAADAASRKVAERADQLFSQPARDLPARVARVNQFWTEGRRPVLGAAEAPFVSSPGTRRGFAPNENADPASVLYQPQRTKNALTDLGITAMFGGESALTQATLEPEARSELQAAQEAVSRDPSEANIQRLQAAKDRFAGTEFVRNIGRGAAFSYPGSGLKFSRSPSRPNVSAAEAERIRIDQMFGPSPRAPRSSTPRPTQSEAGTWHGPDGRFVSPPSPRKR
jgi:hypothetical protein